MGFRRISITDYYRLSREREKIGCDSSNYRIRIPIVRSLVKHCFIWKST